VQRVAAKYLTLANTTIHEYEPLTAGTRTFEAESFASTVAAWAPGFGQPVDKAVRAADASSSLDPVPQGSERSPERQAALESVQPLPIRDFSTLNGPKAFVREDHSRPTVTVAILFQGGRLIEDSSTSGTTELMLRSILYGTQRTTYSLVTQELEQLGAEVRIVVEPDFFGFVLNTLSRNADRALKLLRDMIEGPAFRKDDVGRARLGQIAEIRDSRDSGFARSRELLLQTLYDGHPYSLPAHGREEVVAALTGEKLTEWYARAVEKQLPLAIIVGDTDGSALVSSQLAEGFRRRDVDAAIQVRTPRSGAAAERAESRRIEQSTIAIGMNGPRAGSRDLIAVELFESMLNGEGGGLLRELRDKQGLVFTANVSSEAMFVSGLIVAYSTMSAEHEQRAKTALIAEFERLGRAGLSADEMTSARALATTSRIAMVQSQPQHALRYACAIFYKQPAADVDTFGEEIGKVSFEDIKRVGSAIFKTSSVSTAIVRGSRQSPSPPPTAKQN
ncbi:MAG TPA: pitrilysin family protein, partial [Blastocatellia bacterium]|nr:pitrilysin family protein [Blastocatellia bacterium]